MGLTNKGPQSSSLRTFFRRQVEDTTHQQLQYSGRLNTFLEDWSDSNGRESGLTEDATLKLQQSAWHCERKYLFLCVAILLSHTFASFLLIWRNVSLYLERFWNMHPRVKSIILCKINFRKCDLKQICNRRNQPSVTSQKLPISLTG